METDQKAGKGGDDRRTVGNCEEVAQVAQQPGTMRLDREAREYDMSHPRRGRAVLFNQSMGRQGSEQDCRALEATLAGLGFEVTVYRDSSKQKVVRLMEEVGREDHSAADCLLVAVMSHGEEGYLWDCLSHKYSPSCLWAPLTADLCPSLAGKPKVFLVQACQGGEVQGTVAMGGPGAGQGYRLPVHADFLVVSSTIPGHVSYRSPDQGGYFIQVRGQ